MLNARHIVAIEFTVLSVTICHFNFVAIHITISYLVCDSNSGQNNNVSLNCHHSKSSLALMNIISVNL